MVVLEGCHQICMTYTSAECRVENSWWWAEELPKTCRVFWQNKFAKLVRLLVLLKRKMAHKCIIPELHSAEERFCSFHGGQQSWLWPPCPYSQFLPKYWYCD